MPQIIGVSRGRFQVYPPPGTRPNKPRQLFPWLPGFYLFQFCTDYSRPGLRRDNRPMPRAARAASLSPDMAAP